MSPSRSQIVTKEFLRNALENCERRYDELLRAVTDYTYSVTVENGVAVKTTHSAACLGVTGYSSEEYEAQSYLWLNMIYPEDRNIVLKQISDIIGGQDSSIIEHRINHKDGSIRWIQNTLFRRYDENNNLISYDGLIRDITDKKNADDNLAARTKELERINEELQSEITSRKKTEKDLLESENKLKIFLIHQFQFVLQMPTIKSFFLMMRIKTFLF